MFYFPILNITFAFRAELMEIPLKLILLQETEDRSTKNYSLLTTLFVAPSLFLLIPSQNLITFVNFFLKKKTSADPHFKTLVEFSPQLK